jgi:hypothetical protein
MRLSVMVLSAALLVSPLSFAGGKSEHKKLAKQCREENPGASKADIKKCVKEKSAAK